MNEHLAFTGTLTSVRHLKTSGDLQFTITVDKSMANEALRRAGGFPDPATSRWMAVAVLDNEAGNPATPLRASHAEDMHDGDADNGAASRRGDAD